MAADAVEWSKILDELEQTISARRGASQDDSYVAGLLAGGDDKILKKIGEEAIELVMAGKDGEADKILYEAADLCFHAIVFLVHKGLSYKQVLAELARRSGTSGISEKRSRVKESDLN